MPKVFTRDPSPVDDVLGVCVVEGRPCVCPIMSKKNYCQKEHNLKNVNVRDAPFNIGKGGGEKTLKKIIFCFRFRAKIKICFPFKETK